MNVGIIIARGLSKVKQLSVHESWEGNPRRRWQFVAKQDGEYWYHTILGK